jgi:hypothetical protein
VYTKYIQDAEREGDTELVEFFREVRDQDAPEGPEGQEPVGQPVEKPEPDT